MFLMVAMLMTLSGQESDASMSEDLPQQFSPFPLHPPLSVVKQPAHAVSPWSLGMMIGNDYLVPTRPGNDRGMTSDIEVYSVWHDFGFGSLLGVENLHNELRAGVRHTIFTEDVGGGMARWDVGKLYIQSEIHTPILRNLHFIAEQYLDAFYRGDLGGGNLQNFVHELPMVEGRTLGNGLPDQYPKRSLFGTTLGLGGRTEWVLPSRKKHLFSSWSLGSHGQFAPLGLGINQIKAETTAKAEVQPLSHTRIFTQVNLGMAKISTQDQYLRHRGGFNNEMGPVLGPNVDLGLRFLTEDKEWLSVYIRVQRNPEGTGTLRGTGTVGWVGLEWGQHPWLLGKSSKGGLRRD